MDEYQRALDEYRQIQELRNTWSGFIMNWLKVMVPIGGGLFGFLSWLVKTSYASNVSWVWLLPFLGWIVFVVSMFAWRIIAHHLTRQITAMYPRLLELEQRMGWTGHAIYHLNNLSPGGSRKLERILDGRLDGLPERRNYRLYRRACEARGADPLGVLLHIWDRMGYESVGSRGHAVQDILVCIVSLATLFIAFVIAGSPTCLGNYLQVIVLGGVFILPVVVLGGVFTLSVIVMTLLLTIPGWAWN